MTPEDHRIALITGANRGLGRSEALALARTGVGIILTYRSNADEAAAVVAEIEQGGGRAVALHLDTTDLASFAGFADQVRSTLQDQWGREHLDILVNNAGSAAATPIGATDEADVRALVEVHFVGVVFLTQALLPLLPDGGRILNTSTGLARFTGDGGYSVYAAMKGAIEVYTRYLAKELGPRRIAVNAIAPGPTGTDFAGGALRDNDQVRSQLAGQVAMGGVGEPDAIGQAAAAILAEGNGWVTGQRIEASGGMLL